EAKAQERGRRRRELGQPVEVELGDIVKLEIINILVGILQRRHGEIHIREARRDQGRTVELACVGVPGGKGAPLGRRMSLKRRRRVWRWGGTRGGLGGPP